MNIRIASVMPSRLCDFCLGLQDDSVFADFSRDEEGRVFLERISFDGFGCHDSIERVEKMSSEDSDALSAEIQNGTVDSPIAQRVLRDYFESCRAVLWEDALIEHSLVDKGPIQPPQPTTDSSAVSRG